MAGKPSKADLDVLGVPVRETLQERVYAELRQALMRGAFAPGSVLQLREVASAMGTSAMPVREALRQLVAEHAIEVLPNRAFAVARISKAVLQDLAATRMLVEGAAAERAAVLAGPAIIKDLRRSNDEMTAAVKAGDRTRYRSANQEFHFCIYAAANSPIMSNVIETLWLQAGPYLSLSFADNSTVPIVFQNRHEQAIEAINRSDGEAARIAIAGDISDAMEKLLPLV
jgi:DNA-binding GntR family transcriptional regulator